MKKKKIQTQKTEWMSNEKPNVGHRHACNNTQHITIKLDVKIFMFSRQLKPWLTNVCSTLDKAAGNNILINLIAKYFG